MRQRAYPLETVHRDGRNHAMRDTGRSGPRAHRRRTGAELRRIEVTVGVDPIRHTGKTLSSQNAL